MIIHWIPGVYMIVNNKKYGFTLAELLVTLAVIGVVSLITLSIVRNVTPNKDFALAKKSLDIAQRNVQLLTNDSTIYIDGTFDSFPLVNGSEMSTTEKDNYFCEKFVDQLNIKGTVNCSASGSSDNYTNPSPVNIDNQCDNGIGSAAFKTTDGIEWYKLRGQFEENKYKIICVKVSDDARAFGIAIREDGRTIPGEILSKCLDAKSTGSGNADCPLYD